MLRTTATWCWFALANLVCCEWVEISQHHYRPRKPYGNTSILEHTLNQPNRRIDFKDLDHSNPNTRFSDDNPAVNFKTNRNTTWNPPNKRVTVKTVDNTRFAEVTAVVNPSYGSKVSDVTPAINFKDFQDRRITGTPNIHIEETTFKGQSAKRYDVTPTVYLNQDFADQGVTEVPKRKETGLIHGTIEKVPNVGSVKRVQLSNTPIKSPNINTNNIPNRRFGNEDNRPGSSEFSDEFDIKSDIFKDSYEEVVSITPESHKDNNLKTKTNTDFTEDKPSYSNNHENLARPKSKPEITAKKIVETEPKDQTNSSEPSTEKVTDNYNTITTETHSKSKANKIDGQVITKSVKNEKASANDFKYPDDNNSSEKTNDFKVSTMENLVKFMKVVTDTISKNTRRGVNGKVKYLSELKDNLMQNIKYRIDACWPDENASVRRRSRAATSRGHVEFPSSESALMTISFLTFAVFLIKLVLQVIQTYKNKAMIMAPVMVATAGRTFSRKQDKHL